MNAPPQQNIAGEPSLHLSNPQVDCYLTLRGGHLAPVTFQLGNNTIATPYSMPPWSREDATTAPPLLQILRGDFFCFPFGENDEEKFPHGDTANNSWQVNEVTTDSATLSMDLQTTGGQITKNVHLREGHRVLYQQHNISKLEGAFNYGHHPILRLPDGVQCPVRSSHFSFGQVYPDAFTNPAIGEYSALQRGAHFEQLEQVPLATGGTTSLATYPQREGYEDLVMLSAFDTPLAWTAISFPDYVWISVRSVVQFPSTLFWMSHGGRHQSPWAGKHRSRIGIEDVCSHFHDGAAISAQDLLATQGIKTSHQFDAHSSVVLRHSQMVHPIKGQPGLAELLPLTDRDLVQLRFEDGTTTEAPLAWRWLLEPDQ